MTERASPLPLFLSFLCRSQLVQRRLHGAAQIVLHADLKHQMDSEEYGGAPFLGAKQPVIKAHGSSKAKGIKNAIRQAKICVENDLCGTMQSALDELAAAQKTEE